MEINNGNSQQGALKLQLSCRVPQRPLYFFIVRRRSPQFANALTLGSAELWPKPETVIMQPLNVCSPCPSASATILFHCYRVALTFGGPVWYMDMLTNLALIRRISGGQGWTFASYTSARRMLRPNGEEQRYIGCPDGLVASHNGLARWKRIQALCSLAVRLTQHTRAQRLHASTKYYM